MQGCCRGVALISVQGCCPDQCATVPKWRPLARLEGCKGVALIRLEGCKGVALIRLEGVTLATYMQESRTQKSLALGKALSGWNGLWLVGSGFFDALTFKPFEEISLFFSVLT